MLSADLCFRKITLTVSWRMEYWGTAIVWVEAGGSQGRNKSYYEPSVAMQTRNNEGLSMAVAESEITL